MDSCASKTRENLAAFYVPDANSTSRITNIPNIPSPNPCFDDKDVIFGEKPYLTVANPRVLSER